MINQKQATRGVQHYDDKPDYGTVSSGLAIVVSLLGRGITAGAVICTAVPLMLSSGVVYVLNKLIEN